METTEDDQRVKRGGKKLFVADVKRKSGLFEVQMTGGLQRLQ
jgi:hypothetical protein